MVSLTRRETLAAGAATAATGGASNVSLEPLTSRSGVYTPARGRAALQFGFDFPEPSAPFASLLFGFRVNTFENAYALDAARTRLERSGDSLRIVCEGLLGDGGQTPAPGRLTAELHRDADGAVQWKVRASAAFAVKSITTVVRGLPRGQLSIAAGEFIDHGDDELIFEYPQLKSAMSTPLAALQGDDGSVWALSARQIAVRPARFFFQPGPEGYRVELIHEHEGWNRSTDIETALWRVGKEPSFDIAAAKHFAHVEKTYAIPHWETRPDAPDWMRRTGLVLALHGAHWTGYIFNDYARQREILRWTATQVDPARVMVFLPAWDGRYYWNYPRYLPDPRMGGADGFRRLMDEGHRLGFHLVPMFGSNSANLALPEPAPYRDAGVRHIDGDAFDLNWVDWDNDRRGEGWSPVMNLAVDSWGSWLTERIASVLSEFGADGYFLDIAGLWENNLHGDMFEGHRRLVANLALRHPGKPPIGEMLYDAQMACTPMSQVVRYPAWPAGYDAYVRGYQHLSRPAPGRGSTGVHEAGFSLYDQEIKPDQRAIPTLTVVDDTFSTHRQAMADYIAGARRWMDTHG